ncbi:MAG TPA: hypothetical protein VMR23_14675 [Candidatus Limnocylindria bacterium]|nr:hypothetical protein [Candidatus Limnocylindria bacterium]
MTTTTTPPATLPRRRAKGRYAQRLRGNTKPSPSKLRGLPRLESIR